MVPWYLVAKLRSLHDFMSAFGAGARANWSGLAEQWEFWTWSSLVLRGIVSEQFTPGYQAWGDHEDQRSSELHWSEGSLWDKVELVRNLLTWSHWMAWMQEIGKPETGMHGPRAHQGESSCTWMSEHFFLERRTSQGEMYRASWIGPSQDKQSVNSKLHPGAIRPGHLLLVW